MDATRGTGLEAVWAALTEKGNSGSEQWPIGTKSRANESRLGAPLQQRDRGRKRLVAYCIIMGAAATLWPTSVVAGAQQQAII